MQQGMSSLEPSHPEGCIDEAIMTTVVSTRSSELISLAEGLGLDRSEGEVRPGASELEQAVQHQEL